MYYFGGGGRFCPATIPPPLIILFWIFSGASLFHSHPSPAPDVKHTTMAWPISSLQTGTEWTHDFTKPIRGILRASTEGFPQEPPGEAFLHSQKFEVDGSRCSHLSTTGVELAWEWRQCQREPSDGEKLNHGDIDLLHQDISDARLRTATFWLWWSQFELDFHHFKLNET